MRPAEEMNNTQVKSLRSYEAKVGRYFQHNAVVFTNMLLKRFRITTRVVLHSKHTKTDGIELRVDDRLGRMEDGTTQYDISYGKLIHEILHLIYTRFLTGFSSEKRKKLQLNGVNITENEVETRYAKFHKECNEKKKFWMKNAAESMRQRLEDWRITVEGSREFPGVYEDLKALYLALAKESEDQIKKWSSSYKNSFAKFSLYLFFSLLRGSFSSEKEYDDLCEKILADEKVKYMYNHFVTEGFLRRVAFAKNTDDVTLLSVDFVNSFEKDLQKKREEKKKEKAEMDALGQSKNGTNSETTKGKEINTIEESDYDNQETDEHVSEGGGNGGTEFDQGEEDMEEYEPDEAPEDLLEDGDGDGEQESEEELPDDDPDEEEMDDEEESGLLDDDEQEDYLDEEEEMDDEEEAVGTEQESEDEEEETKTDEFDPHEYELGEEYENREDILDQIDLSEKQVADMEGYEVTQEMIDEILSGSDSAQGFTEQTYEETFGKVNDFISSLLDGMDYIPYVKEQMVDYSAKPVVINSDKEWIIQNDRDKEQFYFPEIYSSLMVEHLQIVSTLQNIFMDKIFSRTETRKVVSRSGKRLRSSELLKMAVSENHYKSEYPFFSFEAEDKRSIAASILVDNSGSMSGRRIKVAEALTIALAETFRKVNIANEITGFTTGSVRGDDLSSGNSGYFASGRRNAIRNNIFKTFDQEDLKYLPSMSRVISMSGNSDGASMEYAGARLLDRTEDRKFFFLISDGQPVGYGGGSVTDSGLHHIKAVREAMEEKGVEVYTIGIDNFYMKGKNVESCDKFYGKGKWVNVDFSLAASSGKKKTSEMAIVLKDMFDLITKKIVF